MTSLRNWSALLRLWLRPFSRVLDAEPADHPYLPINMPTPAIRFMGSTGSKGTARILLLCHVKPGVSANREGIAAVTDERIEVCVTSQARDGEANTAVRSIIADVLKLPKSDILIAKGEKSRNKTVAVNVRAKASPEEKMAWIRMVLLGNVKL